MPYTYHRDKDGVDDTFDIMTPNGKHLVSVRFWDEPDMPENLARAEAKARLITFALNAYAKQQASLWGRCQRFINLIRLYFALKRAAKAIEKWLAEVEKSRRAADSGGSEGIICTKNNA